MIVHESNWNKNLIPRCVAEMEVYLANLGSFSGLKYAETFGELVSVCGFDTALKACQLIDYS